MTSARFLERLEMEGEAGVVDWELALRRCCLQRISVKTSLSIHVRATVQQELNDRDIDVYGLALGQKPGQTRGLDLAWPEIPGSQSQRLKALGFVYCYRGRPARAQLELAGP